MGKKILIIDDDLVIQESLQEFFGDLGYTVILSSDGISGLELIAKEKPDLVVTDILLPRMHGVALCEKIKANDDLKNIPIILMTGVYKDVNLRMYVYKGLADDFIEKPFREEDLLVKIERFIGSSQEKEKSWSAGQEAPASEDQQKNQPGKSVDKDLDDLISWAHNSGKQ